MSVKQILSTVLSTINKMSPLLSKNNMQEQYVMDAPSDQHAIDIFYGEWSSLIPQLNTNGKSQLFDDNRIKLFEKELKNGFKGKNILELGPLEGGHTYMMSQMGAKHITSVEANTRAYLKFLITKEIFKLKNTEVFIGDFNKIIDKHIRYDFVLACGVIYHCLNPVKTLQDIAKSTDFIGIWSHYFDADYCRPIYGDRFDYKGKKINCDGFSATYHQLDYRHALNWCGFCGGGNPSTNWMPKSDWINLFNYLGYDFEILSESQSHPNGPEFTAIAKKNDRIVLGRNA